MGEPGIDILYYLVTAKGSSDAARLAGDLLKRPEVAARGSKAMQIAWAMRNAKGCDAKRALFGKAKDDGDGRTFGQLALLDRPCGRRRRADPSCCLPNDPELNLQMGFNLAFELSQYYPAGSPDKARARAEGAEYLRRTAAMGAITSAWTGAAAMTIR